VSTSRPSYVVTGGAGFVGANLVAALLAREGGRPHVVVVDTFRSGSFANIVEACERRGAGAFDGEVVAASSADDAILDRLERTRPAAVFHIGAITDTTVSDETVMIRQNVGNFAAMLAWSAAAGVPLVYASSAATYGTPPQARERVPFPVEAAGSPSNVYGFSKWMMECEHRRFAERELAAGRKEPWVVGLRYFNVFGPGESRKGKMASMVYQLSRQVIEGKRPRIFADGAQARDQVHVDDVVECTLAAAGLRAGHGTPANGKPGEGVKPAVYNLGSGIATSFNDIVDAVREGAGVSARERPTDYFPMPAEIRAFYQDYTCADMAQTERGLSWRPRREPRAAMREYAAWLAKQPNTAPAVSSA
jgi:ADP-L-glycero-D-manno-heptose 6-epimerase